MVTTSIFDDDDEAAAQRSHVRRFSLLILINVSLYVPWGYVQRWASPAAIDPLGERAAVYGLIVGLIALANYLTLATDTRLRLIAANRWIIGAHYFSLIARNHVSLVYALPGFFLVFFFTAAFEKPRDFAAFAVFMLACSFFCVSHDPELSTRYFRLTIALSLFLSYSVMVNRRHLRESVESREQLLREVFSSASVGLALLDVTGKIVTVNQTLAAMLGLAQGQFRGRLLDDFAPGDTRRTIRGAIPSVANGIMKEACLELPFRGCAGDTIWGKVSLTRITPRGHSPFLLALIEDITAQREAESLIRDRQEKMHYSARMAALGEMAGGIAHEINNPLAVIDATVRVVRERLARGEASPEFLDESHSSIQKMIGRITKIIKGLRRFSRDGSQDPLQIIGLRSLVLETLSLCEESLRSQRVELTVDVPTETWISGRGVEISQVILNVVNNALDALKPCPVKRLGIRARRDAGAVYLDISNSGPVIPPDVAEKIFQPFFTTKPVGQGVGLGLSISLGMMSSQGGGLTLERSRDQTCFALRMVEAKAPADLPDQGGTERLA